MSLTWWGEITSGVIEKSPRLEFLMVLTCPHVCVLLI